MIRRRSMLAAGAALTSALVPEADLFAAEATVVLELFTSEGCSSCPPADALLGELVRSPGVIGLSWHVDYWNHLGWHDPLSSRLATDRQRAYAARFGEQVYTPAMVVNGRAMVVGSDRPRIRSAIAAQVPLPVAVTMRSDEDGVHVRIGAIGEQVSALLVLIDPKRETQIGAGENDGRRLQEFNIVRQADAAMIGGGQGVRFRPTPPGMAAACLLQDEALHLLGAAMVPARVVQAA